MHLADARALLADLATARADAAADRRGLERLALWCNRFTPWCAVDDGGDDGGGGLLLDITGCAHLFGGEAALMDEIAARLTGLGIENRLGLADTPGAAWALARFGPAENGRPESRIAAPGEARTAITDLPVEALRLAAEDAHLLRRLGLVTIGAADGLPRASLARRFPGRERGSTVLARLDRALGRQAEPIVPMIPPPACLERLALPEPLIDRAGLDAMLARLMPGLTASLERDGLGARRLALWCYRVDGGVVRREVSTARATRDGDHLQAPLSRDAGDHRPRLRHRLRGASCRARRAPCAQAAFSCRWRAEAGRSGPAGRSPAGAPRHRRRLPPGACRPPQAGAGRAGGRPQPGPGALA